MQTPLARRRERLLDRVLSTPNLVHAVRALPPATLATLVSRVGIEDAGEIIALTTTEQLTHLFDEDVFGDEEELDPDRFALWLEVMLEAGDTFTAQRVVELPDDLVQAAVHAFVMVLDLDALAVAIQDDTDLTDANDALEAAQTEELDGYLLVVKRHDGWDAMWTTLLALAEQHSAYLHALLARLCEADMEFVEEHGLYDVLSSAEMLAEDAAHGREERRARRGFVSLSDARAFLTLAREGKGDPDERDAITAAWLRRLDRRIDAIVEPAPDLEALLVGAGIATSVPRLPARSGSQRDPSSRLRAAMEQLAARAPELHHARMEELAFLANVLSAGARIDERQMRSIEAVELAVATCGAGLVRRSADPSGDADMLATRPLDLLFRDGYAQTPAAAPGRRRLE